MWERFKWDWVPLRQVSYRAPAPRAHGLQPRNILPSTKKQDPVQVSRVCFLKSLPDSIRCEMKEVGVSWGRHLTSQGSASLLLGPREPVWGPHGSRPEEALLESGGSKLPGALFYPPSVVRQHSRSSSPPLSKLPTVSRSLHSWASISSHVKSRWQILLGLSLEDDLCRGKGLPLLLGESTLLVYTSRLVHLQKSNWWALLLPG